MNFGTIGGFMQRNGMKILKKTALAAGVIAGLAFLTDTPDEEFDEFETTCEDVTSAEETEKTADDSSDNGTEGES